MAMSFNMILILYAIPCKLSCDFSKLTILYLHVHIFLYLFYDKEVSNVFMSINIYIFKNYGDQQVFQFEFIINVLVYLNTYVMVIWP